MNRLLLTVAAALAVNGFVVAQTHSSDSNYGGLIVSERGEGPKAYYCIKNMRVERLNYLTKEVFDSSHEEVIRTDNGAQIIPSMVTSTVETPELWQFPYMGLCVVNGNHYAGFSAMTRSWAMKNALPDSMVVMDERTRYWWFEKGTEYGSLVIHNAVIDGSLSRTTQTVNGRTITGFSTEDNNYYVVPIPMDEYDIDYDESAFALSTENNVNADSRTCLDVNNYIVKSISLPAYDEDGEEMWISSGEIDENGYEIMQRKYADFGFAGMSACWTPVKTTDANYSCANGSLFSIQQALPQEVELAIASYEYTKGEIFRQGAEYAIQQAKTAAIDWLNGYKNLPALYPTEQVQAIIDQVNAIEIDCSSVSSVADIEAITAEVMALVAHYKDQTLRLAGDGTVITLQNMLGIRDWQDASEVGPDALLCNAYLSSNGYGEVRWDGAMEEVGYAAVKVSENVTDACKWTMEYVTGKGYRLKNGNKYIHRYDNWLPLYNWSEIFGSNFNTEEGILEELSLFTWALTENADEAAIFTFEGCSDPSKQKGLTAAEEEYLSSYYQDLGYSCEDDATDVTNNAFVVAKDGSGNDTWLFRDSADADFSVVSYKSTNNRWYAESGIWKINVVKAGIPVVGDASELEVEVNRETGEYNTNATGTYRYKWSSTSTNPQVVLEAKLNGNTVNNFAYNDTNTSLSYNAGSRAGTLVYITTPTDGWTIVGYSFDAERNTTIEGTFTLTANDTEYDVPADSLVHVEVDLVTEGGAYFGLTAPNAANGVYLHNFKVRLASLESGIVYQQIMNTRIKELRDLYTTSRGVLTELLPTYQTTLNELEAMDTDVSRYTTLASVNTRIEEVTTTWKERMDSVMSSVNGKIIRIRSLKDHVAAPDSLKYDNYLSSNGASLCREGSKNPVLSDWRIYYAGDNTFTFYNKLCEAWIGHCPPTSTPWPVSPDAFEADKFHLIGFDNPDYANCVALEAVSAGSNQYRFIHKAEGNHGNSTLNIVAWGGQGGGIVGSVWAIEVIGEEEELELIPGLPDLKITDLKVEGDVLPGEEVNISWTIVNEGEGTAVAPFTSHIWLASSLGRVNNNNSTHVAVRSVTENMNPGDSCSFSHSYVLPEVWGSRYIIATADFRDIESFASDKQTVTINPAQRQLTETDASPEYTDNVRSQHIILAQINEHDWEVLTRLNNTPAEETIWDLNGGRENTYLSAVTTEKGAVKTITISNRALNMYFPVEIFELPSLTNVSFNNIGLYGDINARMNEVDSVIAPLQSMSIQSNALEGNLSRFADRIPTITSISAFYNKFHEFLPKSAHCNFGLMGQRPDIVTEISLSELYQPEVLIPKMPEIFQWPQIMNYNGYYDIYDPSDNVELIYFNYHGETDPTNYSYTKTYRGLDGDTVIVDIQYPDIWGTQGKFLLHYDAGDANFDGNVNVSDLQSSVLYAFDEYKGVYNFYAGNLYADDEVINVQDVVRTVDLLLTAPDSIAPMQSRRRVRSREEIAPDGQLYWDGNRLVLNAREAVGALRIDFASPVALSNVSGQSLAIATSGNRAIIYSPQGESLGNGETIIATAKGSTPQILTVDASSTEARNMTIAPVADTVLAAPAMNAVQTEVRATKGGNLEVNSNTGMPYRYQVVNAAGLTVATGSAEGNATIATSLNQGIYIVTISSDQEGAKTRKIFVEK